MSCKGGFELIEVMHAGYRCKTCGLEFKSLKDYIYHEKHYLYSDELTGKDYYDDSSEH